MNDEEQEGGGRQVLDRGGSRRRFAWFKSADEDGKLEAGRGARLNQRVWKMSVFLATTTTCKSRPTKEERLASEAN